MTVSRNPYQPPDAQVLRPHTEVALRFWQSVPSFIGGCFGGLLVLLSARVLYYDWMRYEPNMHPGIVFVFLPVLMPMVLAVAIPIEALLQWLLSKPANKTQAFCLGVIGASLVSWWAFPSHWYVIAVLNPIVLRWAVPGMTRVRQNKQQSWQ